MEKSSSMEWKKDSYIVSDDSSKLDLDAIHVFLTNSYWAKNRTKEVVATSIQNSFTLGMYTPDGQQMGFSRVITDYVTFAYLCDVYILETHRKNKLGHFLMECLFEHPKLSAVKWILKTTNAQSLYRDFNFVDFESSFGWMTRARN